MEDFTLTEEQNRKAREEDALLLLTTTRVALATQRAGEDATLSFDRKDTENRDFNDLFYAHSELGAPYHSFRILIDNGGVFDIVPSTFIGDSIDPDIWLPGRDQGTTLLREGVKDESFEVIFTIDTALKDFIERSFSREEYCHPVTNLIETGLLLSRKSEHSNLTAMLSRRTDGEVLDIVHCSAGKVLFANRFSIASPTDVLYYLTAVWRSEGLETSRDALYFFSDDITREQEQALGALRDSICLFRVNDFEVFGSRAKVYASLPLPLKMKLLCE